MLKMKEKIFSSAVAAILFGFCCYECYLSLEKYLARDIGQTLKTDKNGVYRLPSITVCPYLKREDLKLNNFDELYGNLTRLEDYLHYVIYCEESEDCRYILYNFLEAEKS